MQDVTNKGSKRKLIAKVYNRNGYVMKEFESNNRVLWKKYTSKQAIPLRYNYPLHDNRSEYPCIVTVHSSYSLAVLGMGCGHLLRSVSLEFDER